MMSLMAIKNPDADLATLKTMSGTPEDVDNLGAYLDPLNALINDTALKTELASTVSPEVAATVEATEAQTQALNAFTEAPTQANLDALLAAQTSEPTDSTSIDITTTEELTLPIGAVLMLEPQSVISADTSTVRETTNIAPNLRTAPTVTAQNVASGAYTPSFYPPSITINVATYLVSASPLIIPAGVTITGTAKIWRPASPVA
jgi:hypothetical protein